MGRYVTGSDGFEYKYMFGEQPSNLAWLAGRSGAGIGSMVFDYFVEDEDGEENQYGGGDKEVKGLGPAADAGFVSPIRGMEVPFEEGTPNEVVGVAIVRIQGGLGERLRARFGNEATIRMEVCAEYELTKKEHPKLLEYVSRFLPKGKTLTLEELRNPDQESLDSVLDWGKVAKAEYLPLLAFRILAHGVKMGRDKEIYSDEAEWEYEIWPRDDDEDDGGEDDDVGDTDDSGDEEDADTSEPTRTCLSKPANQTRSKKASKPTQRANAKAPAKKKAAKKKAAKKKAAKKKAAKKKAKKRPARKRFAAPARGRKTAPKKRGAKERARRGFPSR